MVFPTPNIASGITSKGKKKTVWGTVNAIPTMEFGVIVVAFGSIMHVNLTEDEARVWAKMGKRAKFYCLVRNCEQIAEHFINIVGPLKYQHHHFLHFHT